MLSSRSTPLLLLRAAGAVWVALGVFIAGSALALQRDVGLNLIVGAVFALIGVGMLRWRARPRPAVGIVGGAAFVVGAGLLAAAALRVFGEGYAVFG
ncbi:hypothetical protein N3K63_11740 [Microbacterium sp. W1N]|uniref:hypothetical protein n=1 Tax=Microbacterium festucae TaxID=2977531 RepID=UPI0021BFC715|nr:hypothetical protein [Microbacterium festucae]MCT9820954.1 hypothetical protein [Microbacterium festucae]